MCLDDIMKQAGCWHVHHVNVGFCEDGSWHCDDRWDESVLCLTYLAQMAAAYEPGDVSIEVRPPEAKDDSRFCCKNGLVTYVVVDLVKCLEATSRR